MSCMMEEAQPDIMIITETCMALSGHFKLWNISKRIVNIFQKDRVDTLEIC